MRFNKLIFNGKEINKLLIEKVLKNTNYNVQLSYGQTNRMWTFCRLYRMNCLVGF